MAQLPGYSPMSQRRLPNPSVDNFEMGMASSPGMPYRGPHDQTQFYESPYTIGRPENPTGQTDPQFPAQPPRGENRGRGNLPPITLPGQPMYDTGQGYVPLYQDIGLGGGAMGTYRNMSLLGLPIYSKAGPIQDFSKVAIQTGQGTYAPMYTTSESGVPQQASGSVNGIPQYRPTNENLLGQQRDSSGQSLQDFFFNMLVNRVAPGLQQGNSPNSNALDWEAIMSQLNSLTNPSDPDSIETIRRLFGI